MFKVKLKSNKNITYRVYAVDSSTLTGTKFLIYTTKWEWRDSGDFVPFYSD